jgi:hypothetical protein
MPLEPVGYYVGETIIPKVSPVNDAKSAVLKRLAGYDLERAPVRLAFLV